ncbi:hypothetical protein NDU88_003816 [Pleurodeles waltl]|uniref:Uncharacterized protein n=1 Tax=Pleurodeles waltl TaxID=8319 RepID=A0AAV7N176_PLEWA|nr:hypothetical protein NDU88_003816 [Pleurodeles waltl]
MNGERNPFREATGAQRPLPAQYSDPCGLLPLMNRRGFEQSSLVTKGFYPAPPPTRGAQGGRSPADGGLGCDGCEVQPTFPWAADPFRVPATLLCRQ